MKQKARVGTCPYCDTRHSKSYLCEAEFESWEIDYELHEKQDWAGLVAHYQAVVEWEDGGHGGLHKLGEAYVLNGEPEKAIELLSEPHRQNPDDVEFQHVILDALFALGKDETDFDWVERMPVYRLDDSSFLDRCHAYLKPKRKPRNAGDLRWGPGFPGYCAFSDEELLGAIRRDSRFVVEEDVFGYPEFRARRKRDGKPKPLQHKENRRLRTEGSGNMMTSRESWKLSAGEVSVAGAAKMPVIFDPDEDDPELDRTRLYPMWGGQKLYGETSSREEEESRQEMEFMTAEYYHQKGDVQGEIALYLAILTRRPNDLATLYCLGRAYLEIGDAERVVEVIGAAHRAYPRLLDFQDLLLDALFALGKDEADFEWATELRVFRLDQTVIDRCYEYLKRKRRPRYAAELEAQFSLEGCCRFIGSELVEALAKDDRFVVEGGGVLRRRKHSARPRCRGAVLQSELGE